MQLARVCEQLQYAHIAPCSQIASEQPQCAESLEVKVALHSLLAGEEPGMPEAEPDHLIKPFELEVRPSPPAVSIGFLSMAHSDGCLQRYFARYEVLLRP